MMRKGFIFLPANKVEEDKQYEGSEYWNEKIKVPGFNPKYGLAPCKTQFIIQQPGKQSLVEKRSFPRKDKSLFQCFSNIPIKGLISGGTGNQHVEKGYEPSGDQ